jgi:hypothetical protein
VHLQFQKNFPGVIPPDPHDKVERRERRGGQEKGGEGREGKEGEGREGRDGVNPPPPRKQILATALPVNTTGIAASCKL